MLNQHNDFAKRPKSDIQIIAESEWNSLVPKGNGICNVCGNDPEKRNSCKNCGRTGICPVCKGTGFTDIDHYCTYCDNNSHMGTQKFEMC